MVIQLALVFLLQFDKPFNQVTLSENNQVHSSGLPTWVDTVVHVGLYVASLKGQNVFVSRMPEVFQDNLNAFVSFKSGNYFIYLQDFNRKEAIEVISHELVHIKQYASGDLSYDEENRMINWRGEEMQIDALEYDLRPWEREAFNQQDGISSDIISILLK